jgi:hypothetical protein
MTVRRLRSNQISFPFLSFCWKKGGLVAERYEISAQPLPTVERNMKKRKEICPFTPQDSISCWFSIIIILWLNAERN